jgi:chromate reductase
MTRLLVTSGSSRTGSFNRKLAAVAAQVARTQGAQVTELDLRELGLPVYDGDIEAKGLPPGALELRRMLAGHDAVLIATPEYNGFVTPLLLNALDWVSRVPAGDALPSGLEATGRLAAGLMSASPGALGGQRGLLFLRSYLSLTIGMLVVPQTQSIPLAHQAFDEQGALKEAKQQAGVERVVGAVLRAVK